MLSHSVADQAGAAKEAPRSRVYRWSSGRQPKTRPSAASLCYEKWSVRSPKFAADNRHIASGSVSPIHKHSGSRIEDTQNHPASGWRPSTFDKPLRWRSATEIRARFWETSGEPPDYTTPWGLLKQPDKQELACSSAACAIDGEFEATRIESTSQSEVSSWCIRKGGATPLRCATVAQNGWSAPTGQITAGFPAFNVVPTIPAPPWCTTRLTRGNDH